MQKIIKWARRLLRAEELESSNLKPARTGDRPATGAPCVAWTHIVMFSYLTLFVANNYSRRFSQVTDDVIHELMNLAVENDIVPQCSGSAAPGVASATTSAVSAFR